MNYNKELTDNDILELIEKDDINRNIYLTKLLNILNNNGFNRIFSLNGKWGTGKTIFIKKFILLINYCSIYTDGKKRECLYDTFNDDKLLISRLKALTDKEEFREIKTISKEKLINAAYFNAWYHDDEEDPIISIIYSLIRQFNLYENTKYTNTSVINKITDLVNAITLGKVNITSTKKEDILKEIRVKDKIKELVHDVIDSIIKENCEKLILFIDELDRCNPLYAIKLLERVKHYFHDERLIIVIATNLDELSNTVSSVYGEHFSSYKYLDKFFDMKLELPAVDKEKYVNTFNLNINNERNSYFSIIVITIIKYNKFEMRETMRYLSLIRYFEKRIFEDDSKGFYNQYALHDYLFIPYIIGLYVENINKYNKFLDGDGKNELITFINNSDVVIDLCRNIFYPNKLRNSINITKETIIEDIEKYYNYIYGDNTVKFSIDGSITVGEMKLYKRDIYKLKNSVSLLEDIKYFQ